MQNVEGGVVIPIQHQPAFRAFVGANGEGFLLFRFTSTPAANLRRSTRVHSDHSTRSFFRFRAEDCDELTPTRVMHALGETHLAESVDVQIFNCDKVILPHQVKCGLEMEITASILYPSMLSGESANHLPAPNTPALSLADSALCSFQCGFSNPQISGVSDSRSIIHRGELSKANINTDGLAGRRKGFHRNIVTTDGNPPIATCITTERDRFYPAFNRARHEQAYCANTPERYPSSFNFHTPDRGGKAVVTASRLESRKPAPTAEKAFERSGYTGDDIFQNLGWHGGEVRPFASNRGQLSYLIETADRLPAHTPSIASFLQGCVVKLATDSKLRFRISNSGRREFRLETKRLTHTSI